MYFLTLKTGYEKEAKLPMQIGATSMALYLPISSSPKNGLTKKRREAKGKMSEDDVSVPKDYACILIKVEEDEYGVSCNFYPVIHSSLLDTPEVEGIVTDILKIMCILPSLDRSYIEHMLNKYYDKYEEIKEEAPDYDLFFPFYIFFYKKR